MGGFKDLKTFPRDFSDKEKLHHLTLVCSSKGVSLKLSNSELLELAKFLNNPHPQADIVLGNMVISRAAILTGTINLFTETKSEMQKVFAGN